MPALLGLCIKKRLPVLKGLMGSVNGVALCTSKTQNNPVSNNAGFGVNKWFEHKWGRVIQKRWKSQCCYTVCQHSWNACSPIKINSSRNDTNPSYLPPLSEIMVCHELNCFENNLSKRSCHSIYHDLLRCRGKPSSRRGPFEWSSIGSGAARDEKNERAVRQFITERGKAKFPKKPRREWI